MDLERLLKACCGEPGRRHAIDRPFRVGDRVYATNGRICVRTSAPYDAEPNASEPGVLRLPWDGAYEDTPLVLPAERLDETPCAVCDGKGELKAIDCSRCRGRGYKPCSCEYCEGHDCEACDATGLIENEHGDLRQCPMCNGSGTDDSRRLVVDLGHAFMDVRHANLILEHGGRLYAPKGKASEPMRIVFDETTDAMVIPRLSCDEQDVAWRASEPTPASAPSA